MFKVTILKLYDQVIDKLYFAASEQLMKVLKHIAEQVLNELILHAW